MVKIEAKKLKEFVEKSTLKGIISEFVLHFTNNGLDINSKTIDGVNAVLAHLNKEVFMEYNINDKKYGIGNSNRFISILGTFEGSVNIDLTDNLLTVFNNNKSASFVLKKPEFITDTVISQTPDVFNKFDNGVKLSSSIFIEASKYLNILSTDIFTVEVKNNILYVEVGDKNFDKVQNKVECQYKDVRAKFQNSLKIVIPCLTEMVTMSVLDNNAPIQLISKTEDYVIRFIAGPASVDDDEEPKVEEVKEQEVKEQESNVESEEDIL